MEIYFDNSATTRCYDSVKDIVVKTMTEDFGNPSAMHLKGVDAEKYVKESAKTIAGILKVQEKEILFTSGGTESDNLALIGGAMANKRNGNHIIITSVEHAAVSQPALYLQEQGFEITYLPVDEQGRVKMDALEAVLRPDTIMVSTMLVNNEVGAVMPVEEIAKMVHAKSPKALYHVDAIQGFGKYRIYPKKMVIDLLAVSGHKIHGPKGTGFLYVADGVKCIRSFTGAASRTDGVPEPRMCRESPDWDWRQRRCTKIILRKYRRCMNAKRISSKNWKRLTKLPFTRLHRNCVSVRRMSSVQALKV